MASASKKLLKQLPTPSEMDDTLFGLLNETDQAAALTGAAYIDHALEVILKAQFRSLTKDDNTRMFDGSANGILGTTSNKIRLAYAIRILDEPTYRDLLLINDIRNVFAHSLHKIDFKNHLIIDDCKKIQASRIPAGLRPTPKTPKEMYFFAILEIYFLLHKQIKRHLLAKALVD